jgi:magnesium chelatase family protein
MIGPPGAGKSMLARRLPSILPPLEPSEMLEVSMIRSLAGDLAGGRINRPFRAPHCGPRGRAGLCVPPGALAPSAIRRAMLDRIDLQIEVPAVSAADLVLPQACEGSAEVRARVSEARRIQTERYAALGQARIHTNAECDGAMLEEIAAPEPAGCDAVARRSRRAVAERTRLPPNAPRRPHACRPRWRGARGRIHIAKALSYRGETLRRAEAAA